MADLNRIVVSQLAIWADAWVEYQQAKEHHPETC